MNLKALAVVALSAVLAQVISAQPAQPVVRTLDAELEARARAALRKATADFELLEGDPSRATPPLEAEPRRTAPARTEAAPAPSQPRIDDRQIERGTEPGEDIQEPQKKSLRERLFGPRKAPEEKEEKPARREVEPAQEEADPGPNRREIRAGIKPREPIPADPPQPFDSKLPKYEPAPEPRLEDLGRATTKEEKLAALLKLYKANVITPNEYHAHRHRIISGQ